MVAPTVVSAVIAWCGSSAVVVSADMVITPGAVLRIGPGITLEIDAGVNIIVRGRLGAMGSEGAPVHFLSSAAVPAANDWVGVSTADASAFVQFSHAEIEGAGTLRGSVNDRYRVADTLVRLTAQGIWRAEVIRCEIQDVSFRGATLCNVRDTVIERVTGTSTGNNAACYRCDGRGVTLRDNEIAFNAPVRLCDSLIASNNRLGAGG